MFNIHLLPLLQGAIGIDGPKGDKVSLNRYAFGTRVAHKGNPLARFVLASRLRHARLLN